MPTAGGQNDYYFRASRKKQGEKREKYHKKKLLSTHAYRRTNADRKTQKGTKPNQNNKTSDKCCSIIIEKCMLANRKKKQKQ